MSNKPARTGLSLSGGGYRAAAFHLGTLKKLHELGVLSRIDNISTISGGSILGAAYCLNKMDFESFEKAFTQSLHTGNVIKKVLLSFEFIRTILLIIVMLGLGIYFLFTSYAWLFPLVLILLVFVLFRFQFALFPASKVIERAYNDIFYQQSTLGQLNDRPALVIGSTNLQTGRLFTFSKHWMQDSAYQYRKDAAGNRLPPVEFSPEPFPVARAVMASSCVPFAFTPVHIARQFFKNPERDYHLVAPQLVDGGVYDNQGIHKIVTEGQYDSEIVITSDAGNKMPYNISFRNTIQLLLRTVEIFMTRIKHTQMVQDIYDNTEYAQREIAYLSLGWDMEQCIPGFINNMISRQVPQNVMRAQELKQEWIDRPKQYRDAIQQWLEAKVNYPAILANKLSPEELQIARTVGTNLTPLSMEQLQCLSRHAANLTELQVKLYCPSLI